MFKGYLRNLPKTEKQILGNVLDLEESELLLLIQSIIQHQFVLGSDGSITPEQASYATRIQSSTNLHHFINSSFLCTTKSSFQAKGLGYLSCLYLLHAIIHYYYLLLNTAEAIKVYIDNKGLLQQLSHGPANSIKHTISKDADLIREILNIEESITFYFNRKHVRSHKFDNKPDYHKIPLPNFVSCCCDILADLAYSTMENPLPENIIFPSTKSYIIYNQVSITTNIHKHLIFATQDKLKQTYLMKKCKFASTSFNNIARSHINKAMKTRSSEQQRAYCKLSHELWATNYQLSKHNNRNDSRCFRCNRLYENWDHVFSMY